VLIKGEIENTGVIQVETRVVGMPTLRVRPRSLAVV